MANENRGRYDRNPFMDEDRGYGRERYRRTGYGRDEGDYRMGNRSQGRDYGRGDYGQAYAGDYGGYGSDDDRRRAGDGDRQERGGDVRYGRSFRSEYGGMYPGPDTGGAYPYGSGYAGGGYYGGDYSDERRQYGYGRYGDDDRGYRTGSQPRGPDVTGGDYGTYRIYGGDYGGGEARGDFGLYGRGQHRGRGPKGYTRSDERIREDVSDCLTDDPHIDASEIEVSIQNGEVTLSGTVDSRFAKRHAEDLADDISGVTHVQNNLRVQSVTTTRTATAGNADMAGTTGAARTNVEVERTGTGTAGQQRRA